MGQFSELIFNNFRYKVSAIVIAIICWYLVQGEEILEVNRIIQIQLASDENYLIEGGNMRYKDATLSGARVLLNNFPERPIEVKIPIEKSEVGVQRFRIDKEYIENWDPRIKLTVHDAYLEVFVDEKATKAIPIKENIQGIPSDDFIVEKTIVEPKRAVVIGLKSKIRGLKYLLTEPIDISDLDKSKVFTTTIAQNDAFILHDSLMQVKISIQLGSRKVNKKFTNIPIEMEGQKYVSQVKPGFVSIELQAFPTVLDFIKASDLRAFLDIRDLMPGVYEKKVRVKIPPDTVLIETLPDFATVEITRRNNAQPE